MNYLRGALSAPYKRGSVLSADGILVAFALLRLTIVTLLVFEVPALVSHDRFYFHHGGDQDYYFAYGRVLAQGSFDQYFAVNLGQPSIAAFAIRVFGAASFSEALVFLVLVNGFLLGGLSVVLVGRFAREVTQDDRTAYLAAGLWTVMPWLLWLAFWPHPNADWLRAPYVPGVAWLQGVPDGPGVFFALLGLYFLARGMNDSGYHWPVLSGAAFGVMLLFRFQLVMLLPLALLALALERRWVGLLLALAATVCGYLPQVIYNEIAAQALGYPGMIPWLPGYLYFGVLSPENVLNPQLSSITLRALPANLIAMLTRSWMLAGLAMAAMLLAGWGLLRAIRVVGWSRAVMLVGAVPASISVLLLSPIFRENLIRFMLPAAPFVSLLLSWIGVELTGVVRRFGARWIADHDELRAASR